MRHNNDCFRSICKQVGGLSVINAIAGAYSESLPIICITGVLAE